MPSLIEARARDATLRLTKLVEVQLEEWRWRNGFNFEHGIMRDVGQWKTRELIW